jgi:hypothetical protein
MRFWTACHEMGHAFNLAHSWQKEAGSPWIPLVNDSEARSFMNYPFRVAGGETAFFADFAFRFIDPELLFMRHAPARFVQMGNADWFDDHAFQQAAVSAEPNLRLELRVNRAKPLFEFLEPVVLELKLTNTSSQPQLVDQDLLSAEEAMTVILKKKGKPARQWAPFARYCGKSGKTVLAPGDSIYESLFVSAGLNGCDLAEPGVYTVQMALRLDGEDIVSNPLHLRVAPPLGYDEELIAQDFFSEDVGRVLAFDGSQFLARANDTLREVATRLSGRSVALHARVALGNPLGRNYKLLSVAKGTRAMTAVCDDKGRFTVSAAKVNDARRELSAALTAKPTLAAETLGHIDYKYYVDAFSDWLAQRGDGPAAAKSQNDMYKTLSARKVLSTVLDEIRKRAGSYQQAKGRRGPGGKKKTKR